MQRYLWIVVVVIVALSAGWWLGRGTAPAHSPTIADNASTDGSYATAQLNASKHPATRVKSNTPTNAASAAKPLPPTGTPLKQIFDELKARADAGDAEAASRLFRDTQQCKQFQQISRTVPQLALMVLGEKVEGASADQLKSSDAMLGMAQDQLKFLRENASLCNGLSDDISNSTLPLALQAAQLGDAAAIDCYVAGGGEFGMPAGLLDHPEWLSEYKENALPLANAAVEKGDWTMVSQLGWAYGGDLFPGLLSQATGRDAAMAYRYLKLALLGAPSADKDKAVAMLQGRLNGLAGEITTDQKAAADSWAQNAYQNYFQASPANSSYNSFKACPSN